MKQKIRTVRIKPSVRDVVAFILFITLIFSVVYSFVRFLLAPEVIADGAEYEKLKSDYLLMLTQCALGLAVMMIPTIITHRFKLMVPGVMCILYYVFLYCAIFLGEIFSFYYRIPIWDSILHAMSAAMLGALGFILVDWLNKDEHVKLSMNPLFVSLFAFSFALMIGTLWEIYEFSFDSILGLNMQKARLENGTPLIGSAAVTDTMKDLIIDALAALAVAIIGFFTNIKRNKRPTEAECASTPDEELID